MARRARTSVLKRQREAKKRLRERRKAEKAALKRERRHQRKGGPEIATREELDDIGILPPGQGETDPRDSEREPPLDDSETESGESRDDSPDTPTE